MSPVQELFELVVSRGCRPTERAVPSILSWSPPILPFVCLPDVMRFGLVPLQEVEGRPQLVTIQRAAGLLCWLVVCLVSLLLLIKFCAIKLDFQPPQKPN